MSSSVAIGFSQRIRLEWLSRTARLLAEGRTDDEIAAALRAVLSDQLSIGRTPERGSREKAITILLKIWVRGPEGMMAFREQGLELLRRLPSRIHVAVHWAAAMAAYPFLAEVAEITGRLLRLQDEVSSIQVQRRMKERFGERETVVQAARRIQRTFIDWGVIKETNVRGTYVPVAPILVSDGELLAWMAEAALRASCGRMEPIGELRRSLTFFPFDVSGIDVSTLRLNDRLEMFRQGMNEAWVKLGQHASQ